MNSLLYFDPSNYVTIFQLWRLQRYITRVTWIYS